ncbi:hypothetical protein [Paenibacillus sp. NRS-1760]|uniref:hypothetical protein n=1 Tax=Paenibacillus sp. NRS-1760 TaxID=3233902 RepID=UPI003D2D96C9
MNPLKQPQKIIGRHVVSMLETVNVQTGERMVLSHFDDLIEAPNWTRDGKTLIYNSLGRIFAFDIVSRTSTVVESGYATQCNNDHVLSPDNSHLAVSHHTQEDGHRKSRSDQRSSC